jgi:hypothetical protein
LAPSNVPKKQSSLLDRLCELGYWSVGGTVIPF